MLLIVSGGLVVTFGLDDDGDVDVGGEVGITVGATTTSWRTQQAWNSSSLVVDGS